MSGRLLDAVRIVPPVLWRHLGEKLAVPAPDLASLRAMYQRGNTLYEHQQVACDALGFRWLSEPQRRALVQALRQELTRTFDRQRLLIFARRWLYDRRLIIMHERSLRSTIASATRQYETALAKSINAAVDEALFDRWRKALLISRESGLTQQRIEVLYDLNVQNHLIDVPDDLVRRYARRLASRPPSAGRLIREPARTIEVACFLRDYLLVNTDRLLLMVRRCVADVWQHATRDAKHVLIHWADLYRELLGSMESLSADTTVADSEVREKMKLLVASHKARKPPTRAQLVRKHLIAEIRPVRSLLSGLMILPWQAAPGNPVLAALQLLKDLYARGKRALPKETAIDCGRVWKVLLADADREQAFRALEVATLSSLRRALRNGSVWIDHSLAFRSRERLFIPAAQWERERNSYYRRLSLPKDADAFLEPLIERAQAGVEAVSQAAKAGTLKVVDAQVRFSWIMLGREPRSEKELLMVYAGILAQGTSMSAADTARMMPQLSASDVRQAMRWAGDERRLADACVAVLAYMHRHPITQTWGRSDLASSDMMSLETRQRVWQARIDPRRQTPSVGIYSQAKRDASPVRWLTYPGSGRRSKASCRVWPYSGGADRWQEWLR